MLREMRDPAVEAMKRRCQSPRPRRPRSTRVAREWHELQSPRWVPVHASDVIGSLENEVFPHLAPCRSKR
jgi:hypothetical protein